MFARFQVSDPGDTARLAKAARRSLHISKKLIVFGNTINFSNPGSGRIVHESPSYLALHMNQQADSTSLLDYPGYCLALSLLFTAALGLGAYLYTT